MPNFQSKTTKAKLTNIIQAPLLPAEVQEILTLKVPEKDMIDGLQRMLEEGLEVSFIVNTKTTGVSVLLKDSNESSQNAGVGFYTNGRTVREALVATIYKHSLPRGKSWTGFFGERLGETSIS